MRTSSVRMAISAVVLVTAAMTLTACNSHSSSSDAAGSTATSPAASSPSSAQSTAPSTGSAPSAGASGTGSPSSTASGGSTVQTQSGHGTTTSHACASSQLRVSQADEGVGAGQYYSEIVFTNTAGTSCTLTGYPGVSYVKAAGVQSGNAALRSGSTVHTITLAAHGSAHAAMHDANGMSGFPPSQCHLTSVEGLRIYPPNQKAALFLPWKTQHCAGSTIHSLTIGPVQH